MKTVVLGVLVIILGFARSYRSKHVNMLPVNDGKYSDFVAVADRELGIERTEDRRKRWPLYDMSIAGLKASKLLLKDAVQTPSISPHTMEYQKIGTIQSALRDFYATLPPFVHRVKLDNGIFAYVGSVGDRTIVYKSHGPLGKPTIELTQKSTSPNDSLPAIRITYKKESDN